LHKTSVIFVVKVNVHGGVDVQVQVDVDADDNASERRPPEPPLVGRASRARSIPYCFLRLSGTLPATEPLETQSR
jgi:hypothetical protein